MKNLNRLKPQFTIISILLLEGLLTTPAFSNGNGTSSGTTLLEPTSARATALGEAMSAASDDISSMGYNPATLGSLTSGHASFMYEKGLAEDSFGQFLIGTPTKLGGLGLSFGYYNGGEIDLMEHDGTERTVSAKKDMVASLGYSMKLGIGSIGVSGKYISSQLIETEKASAFAGDFGLFIPMGSRINFGAAVQNIGTQMKYSSEGQDLPRIARAGVTAQLSQGSFPLTLLLDAPYHMNESKLEPGVGLEMMAGPLALRAGYKGGNELQNFSFGAGIMLGRMSFDYSYGLVQDLDATHRASLSMRFGGDDNSATELSQNRMPEPVAETPTPRASNPEVTFVQLPSQEDQRRGQVKSWANEVYIVQTGDSLRKIAIAKYGEPDMWIKIYLANKHLLAAGKSLETGQKILLP